MAEQKTKQPKAELPLLMALACGSTVEAAAAKTGLSESSIYRRLRDRTFKKRLQKLK